MTSAKTDSLSLVHPFILAGGLGTRLRATVQDLPKVMAPINGTPFLEFLLKKLKRSGFSCVTLLVGYKHNAIQEYFGDGDKWGMKISYSIEESPLGTAGAVANGLALTSNAKEFLILNGDTYFDIDLVSFVEKAHGSNALALKFMHKLDRYGRVELKDGQVGAFQEKSPAATDGLINGGIYFLQREVIESIDTGFVSLENEILPALATKRALSGQVFQNHFIDIGIPSDYQLAQTSLPQWLAEL